MSDKSDVLEWLHDELTDLYRVSSGAAHTAYSKAIDLVVEAKFLNDANTQADHPGITQEEHDKYIEELVSLDSMNDPEIAHSRADNLLCEIVTKLGCADIVDQYNEIYKWYA